MTHEGLRELRARWEHNVRLLAEIEDDRIGTAQPAYAGKMAAYMTGLETLRRHVASGAPDTELITALQANLDYARTGFERDLNDPGSPLSIENAGAEGRAWSRDEVASLERMIIEAYRAVYGLHPTPDTDTKEN